ncbi:MAG: hypothetical protein IIY72_04590 [Solobacterium sp.]|nr:hypothetical protein [Solobacterium sp.]
MKKELLKKGMTAVLAAGLCACAGQSAGPSLPAASAPAAEEPVVISRDEASVPVRKTETVTVRTDAYGTVEKISTEVELEPSVGTAVHDVTNLTDIRNREGDEEYDLTEAGDLYWQNLGEKIRYEGTGTAELPFAVHVTYMLDGQQIPAEELAGRSGRVTIRFDYTNRTAGAGYVPFLALTMAVLDEDVFSDIEVTNGRVVNAGGETAVIGYAVPGLYQAMKMGNYDMTDEIELPEYVEITARAEDFRLDFTSTVVSDGLFSEIEDGDLKDLDDLSADMKEMGSSFQEVVDGVGSLKDGMGEFGSGMNQYIDGVSRMCGYAGTLSEMSGTVKEKLPGLLDTVSSTTAGIDQMNQMVQALDVPAMESGTAAALAQFQQDTRELENQLTSLQDALTTLQDGMTAVSEYAGAVQEQTAAAAALLDGVDLSGLNGALAAQKVQARDQAAGEIASLGLDDEQEAAVLAAVDEALGSIDISADAAAKQEEVNSRLTSAARILAAVPAAPVIAVPQLDEDALNEVLNDMSTQAEILQAGYGSLGNLPQMTEQLKTSFGQLAAMSALISEQTAQYRPQLESLPGQLNELAAALNALGSASSPLQEGYGKIQEGVQELYDGLKEFNDEAIKEMAQTGGYDLARLLCSIRELRRNDRNYTNYSGLTAGTEGTVRFIFETAEIKP